jgi:hypothetical protein
MFDSKPPSQSDIFNFSEEPVLQADSCHVSLKQFAVPRPSTPSMCIIDYDNYTIVSNAGWDIEDVIDFSPSSTFGGDIIGEDDESEDAPIEQRPSKSWVWKAVVIGVACTIVGLAVARSSGAL